MATVYLSSGLTQYTGGVASVEIDAVSVSDALEMLAARFPPLAAHLADLAVAVDGDIYTQPGYQRVTPSSEIHLLPRIAGG